MFVWRRDYRQEKPVKALHTETAGTGPPSEIMVDIRMDEARKVTRCRYATILNHVLFCLDSEQNVARVPISEQWSFYGPVSF